jgi:hypothetical protein
VEENPRTDVNNNVSGISVMSGVAFIHYIVDEVEGIAGNGQVCASQRQSRVDNFNIIVGSARIAENNQVGIRTVIVGCAYFMIKPCLVVRTCRIVVYMLQDERRHGKAYGECYNLQDETLHGAKTGNR